MAACILKKVVASARSVVIPAFPSASLQTNRRSFFSDVFSTRFLFYKMRPNTASIISDVFKTTPHTVRTTARVINTDDSEVGLSLGEPIKQSINIPRIEKITEASQQFNIFIDLGLKLEADEFDDISSETRLNKVWNLLYLQGYVEKQDVRRNYTAMISLPVTAYLDDKSIQTEINDGGLCVTVPKLLFPKFPLFA